MFGVLMIVLGFRLRSYGRSHLQLPSEGLQQRA
jgi:hypothetical protein